MKKYGKMSSIFELSISKLGYVAVFMKICKKMFDPFFKTFFLTTNQLIFLTNNNEVEKIWKSEFNFSILHIKIR